MMKRLFITPRERVLASVHDPRPVRSVVWGFITAFPARVLTALIRFYQIVLSPYLGAHCRYYPSCSHYAILAIRKDGALKGSAKAAYRILRCNPFSPGGIDHP